MPDRFPYLTTATIFRERFKKLPQTLDLFAILRLWAAFGRDRRAVAAVEYVMIANIMAVALVTGVTQSAPAWR